MNAGFAVLAAVWVLYMLVLRLRSGVARGRAARTVARAFGPGRARRPSARTERRMLARSARSRRASRQFRKALLISALIAAAVLFVHLHPHTH